jgi:hypothetical protein
MIACARNKKAGAIVSAGVGLFMFAIGINTVYSIQTACLDVLPRQCFSGYDALSEPIRMLVTPGAYIIAIAVIVAGAILWFRPDPRLLSAKN